MTVFFRFNNMQEFLRSTLLPSGSYNRISADNQPSPQPRVTQGPLTHHLGAPTPRGLINVYKKIKNYMLIEYNCSI